MTASSASMNHRRFSACSPSPIASGVLRERRTKARELVGQEFGGNTIHVDVQRQVRGTCESRPLAEYLPQLFQAFADSDVDVCVLRNYSTLPEMLSTNTPPEIAEVIAELLCRRQQTSTQCQETQSQWFGMNSTGKS